MVEIGLHNIVKSFGSKIILADVNLTLQTDERVGLLGRNGSGKTTILRIITGLEIPDEGEISIRKGISIGYLVQVPEADEQLSTEAVLKNAFRELEIIASEMRELEKRMETASPEIMAEITDKYGVLQTSFEQKEGYKLEAKLKKIASGLKLGEFLKRKFASLSGGEKTRVLLGKLLLENPDILLLDEPTNHLDIDSVEWLECYLQEYRGAVLLISHDRYFLDRVVDRIVELEMGQTTNYSGNYSFYRVMKQKRFDLDLKDYKSIQKRIKQLKEAALRYRTWGNINTDNNAHMARAKRLEQQIEELKLINKPKQEKKLKLNLKSGSRSGQDAVVMKNVSHSFDENNLFHRVDLQIKYGERVALLGRNGSGKTTVFRLLLAEIKPEQGEIKLGANIKPVYLEQEITFSEVDELSVLEYFCSLFPAKTPEARNILAKFLFTGDNVYLKIKDLSGGEQVRLKLCLLLQNDHNLLLLDEPTNHLDTESREALESALKEYQATLLFVSHDRYFINNLADRIVAISDRKLINYNGDFDYYQDSRTEFETQLEVNSDCKRKNEWKSSDEKDYRKLNEQISELEDKISWQEKSIGEIDNELLKRSGDVQKLCKLYENKQEMENLLRKLYQHWEMLVSLQEQIGSGLKQKQE